MPTQCAIFNQRVVTRAVVGVAYAVVGTFVAVVLTLPVVVARYLARAVSADAERPPPAEASGAVFKTLAPFVHTNALHAGTTCLAAARARGPVFKTLAPSVRTSAPYADTGHAVDRALGSGLIGVNTHAVGASIERALVVVVTIVRVLAFAHAAVIRSLTPNQRHQAERADTQKSN